MTRAALPARRWIADLAASTLLLAVPIAGFWPTFGGPSYLVAAIGGALLGLAIAAVGAWRRWGVLVLAAVTVLAYFVFGGALALSSTTIAGVIPTLETLRRLALGIVTSWKELLTTVTPVSASDGFALVPFLLSLVAAVVIASLALRASHPAWALLPAAAFLAGQIALGTSQPAAPVIEGVVFAVVAIVWLAVRQAWAPARAAVSLGENAVAPRPTRRILIGGAIIAVAVLAGVATSAFAAPNSPRYVLRDTIIPPFDIQQYPSPLQSYRGIVRDEASTSLFTVTGLPKDARVRIATMDAYTGIVYNVSDSGAGSSSAFSSLRSNMSGDAQGTAATMRITIDGYDSVWMPGVGAATSISFDGDRADALRRAAHYNESTETGVVTSGLTKGDAYDLTAVVPVEHSDESLATTPFSPLRMPKQQGVPQQFADLAAKAVAEAKTPVGQVRALQTMLSKGGYFSHGLAGEPLSRAGHGAERISTLLGSQQMVGDDEQYAVAMALLAGQLGIPARVVMGFHPDQDQAANPVFTATGDTLHAWVEVAFQGVGWVPFDPTPPKDQVPTDQTTKPRTDPKPQVLQPPPPQQEPVAEPPTVPDDRGGDKEDKNGLNIIGLVLAIGGGTLGILALLAAPFVVIGTLKARRRRARRAAERGADRISGGWDELVDRAVDYGAPVGTGSTRAEDAAVVTVAFAEPRIDTLARRADADVFGPSDPSPAEIDEFWRQVDDIVGGMGEQRSFWRKVGARLSVRSLLAGTRWDRRGRTRPPVAPTDAGEEQP